MTDRALSAILDRCLDDLAAGRATVAQCLARHPRERAALEPLLEAAAAALRVPRTAERRPDPARRAALMAQIRTLPQERRRGLDGRAALEWLRGTFTPRPGFVPRFAFAAAPMALALLLAFVLLAPQTATPAAASTLTLFGGAVERERDGAWQPLADGAQLPEGARIRTTVEGRALLTFPDGSTSALDPGTEVTLERVAADGPRVVLLRQFSGRLWNDVVTDVRPGASYAVHTPDAVIEVHGTVFGTAIAGGETAVTAAEGEVEVTAGVERATVLPGQAVLARAQRLAQRAELAATGALILEGPFAAALVSANSGATGARPDGAVFRQIPGVTTSNPGVGPQRFDFGQIAAGTYTLLINRFGDGAGNVLLRDADGEHRVTIDAASSAASVQIRVTERDGQRRVELVGERAQPAAPAAAAQVRVVETQRTKQVPDVATQRSNAAKKSETPRNSDGADNSNRNSRGDDNRGSSGDQGSERGAQATQAAQGARGAAPVTPSTPAADTFARDLRQALRSGDAGDLRARLREAATTGQAQRARLIALAAALEDDDDAADRVRAALAGDGQAALRERLVQAAETLPAAERARLLRALGAGAPALSPPRLNPSASPPPQTTPTRTSTPLLARTPDIEAQTDAFRRSLRQALARADTVAIRALIAELLAPQGAAAQQALLRALADLAGSGDEARVLTRSLAGDANSALRAGLLQAAETNAPVELRARLRLAILGSDGLRIPVTLAPALMLPTPARPPSPTPERKSSNDNDDPRPRSTSGAAAQATATSRR